MASQTTAVTTTNTKRSPLEPFRHALSLAQRGLADALPATVAKYLTPERLTKITLAAISRSPYLLQCTPESVLRSVMDAATLGLEPGGPLGHAYLVPFKNKEKIYEAQLIIGYRGLIALARRSGNIQSVIANVVYSNDSLKVNLSEGTIEHAPYMPALPTPDEMAKLTPNQIDAMVDRGRIIAVYCVAKFVGGGQHVDFMTVGDVEKIRKRSRAADNGPWQTDYNEMARKTVVRRAAKFWPLSTELANAMEIEHRREPGELRATQEMPDFQVFDGGSEAAELPPAKTAADKVLGALKPGETMDNETGEVFDAKAAESALADAIRQNETKAEATPAEEPKGDGKTRDQRETEFRERAKGKQQREREPGED